MSQRRSGLVRAGFRRAGTAGPGASYPGIGPAAPPNIAAASSIGATGFVSDAGHTHGVPNGLITNAMLAAAAAQTFKGNFTGAAAAPADNTLAATRGFLTLAFATPAALAAFAVAGLTSGQKAFVVSNSRDYTLRALFGTADGTFIVATSDDAARQWVEDDVFALSAASAGQAAPVVTFASIANLNGYLLASTATVIPSMPGKFWLPIASRTCVVTATGIAATTTATKIGNDAGHLNVTIAVSAPNVAQWNAGPNAVGTLSTPNTVAALDLTAPVVAEVSNAATGTGGGTYRVFCTGILYDSLVA